MYIYSKSHVQVNPFNHLGVSVVEMFTESKEENETTYTIYANFCL